MIEARAFVDSLHPARKVLANERAEFKGYYEIDDAIYRSIDDTVPLSDEFLRLRVLPVNIWPDKDVVLAVKRTNLHAIGKHSDIPTKLQFDSREEAERYVHQHFSHDYVFDYSFFRVGWQFRMPNSDVVDLETIEDRYHTIELKSETDEGIAALLAKFAIKDSDVIKGPSVVAVKQLLAS